MNSLHGVVDNSKYISTGFVYSYLSRTYKSSNFSKADVAEWCGDIVSKVCDIDSLVAYEEDEFVIENGMVMLPCFLSRLFDVYYDKNNSHTIMEHLGNNGSYLYGFPENLKNGDTIYMDYAGLPITSDGELLIPKQYEMVCRKYCMIQFKEDDAMEGNFPIQQLQLMKQELSGLIIASKQSVTNMTTSDFNKLLRIRGNMITKLGFTSTRKNANYHI